MASKSFIRRFRNCYAKLLHLYPKAYRERFGEGMKQTFHDLCRERESTGRGLLGFALWMFFETGIGIIRENRALVLKQKMTRRLLVWATVVALILLVPLFGNHFVDGWNWHPLDFVFAGIILYGAALTYELVARKMVVTSYRSAAGLAVMTALVLLWVNAAVGIIGDGPVNLMYFGVVVLGIIGALTARLEPRGMARTLFAMALAQMLVPVLALLIWNPPFSPGVVPVFILNGIFAASWIGSGLLFRRASVTGSMEAQV